MKRYSRSASRMTSLRETPASRVARSSSVRSFLGTLMGQSHERARAALPALGPLPRPIVPGRGGGKVELQGDGMLAEFSGASAAVRCAVARHAALHRRNAEAAAPDRMRIRAAVHLG